MTAVPDPAPPVDATSILTDLEARLDPARPESAGVDVLAYGEVSCALLVPGLDGWVAKRMSGLRGPSARDAYLALVADYLAELGAEGVSVLPTHPVPVRVGDRSPVVYLLQPRVDGSGLGSSILRDGTDTELVAVLRSVLDVVHRLVRADARRPPGERVAVDAQLSNWWVDRRTVRSDPVLIDVGTPFMQRDGAHALDQEIFLSAIPPGLRAFYRWKGDVPAYLDDYFVPRLVAVDILGNFHKEGRPDRVPMACRVVNAWLAENPEDLGDATPVTPEEVARYYRDDAAELALFLRVRRLDRMIRTKLLRGRYDFVLPGRIAR